jgi:hypothetical protein
VRTQRPATDLRRAVAVLVVAAAAVLGLAAPASADSGGGCRTSAQNSYVKVCISVRSGTTNPLWADFYIDRAGRGERLTNTYINGGCSNGVFFGHFVGSWTVGGTHSPQWSYTKPCASGNAYTHTAFYNSSGVFIYSSDSPKQYW